MALCKWMWPFLAPASCATHPRPPLRWTTSSKNDLYASNHESGQFLPSRVMFSEYCVKGTDGSAKGKSSSRPAILTSHSSFSNKK